MREDLLAWQLHLAAAFPSTPGSRSADRVLRCPCRLLDAESQLSHRALLFGSLRWAGAVRQWSHSNLLFLLR